MYLNHHCLLFEKLGLNLMDFMKLNNFDGFSVKEVKNMSYQLCKGVNFLHKISIIHTDLKPENILLVCDDYETLINSKTGKEFIKLKKCDIKIADLGTAVLCSGKYMITTSHFRSPEVILSKSFCSLRIRGGGG